MNPSDPLAALKPLRLPEPVPWWPPAPGWWLLAALALAALGWIAVAVWRWHRRRAYRRQARAELERRYREIDGPDGARQFAAQASLIMRRAALAAYPRAEVAALCAEDWLRFLDRSGRTTAFSAGAGRALADTPYDPRAGCDAAALHAACRDWLRQHR